MLPTEASEYHVIRNYLDWLVDMPWSKSTKDVYDIKKAQEVLDKEHFGLEKIKDRILEYLSVRKLNPKTKGPILCFVGPPGVGKTSLGKAIANGLPLSGVGASAELLDAWVPGSLGTTFGGGPVACAAMLAVFFLAVLLAAIGFEIAIRALTRSQAPPASSAWALAVMVSVLGVNIVITLWQRYWAKRLESSILLADARHLNEGRPLAVDWPERIARRLVLRAHQPAESGEPRLERRDQSAGADLRRRAAARAPPPDRPGPPCAPAGCPTGTRLHRGC